MGSLLRVWRRLLFLFRCNQMDQDLAEEMQFHIEMKAQEKLQAGMGEKEAEQAAKREFGNALLVKEVSRELWGFLSIESFLQEIRFGLRMLRKNPGFTTGAILTFALGIGANTAMFSIVDGVLLKPLPYANPEQLVQLTETWNGGDGFGPPSWPDFLDWRDRLGSFSGLLGYSLSSTNLQRQDSPVHVCSVQVTANMFELLGRQPSLGRGFLPGEDISGAPCVTVISDALWREQFAADPNVVNRVVTLNNTPCTVVWVAPVRFEFPIRMRNGLWTPIHPEGSVFNNRGSHFLPTIGRLKPGVSLAQGRQEIDVLMRQIAYDYPDADQGRDGNLAALQEYTSGDYRSKLLTLFAAVGVVLLITCVNLANMLLARATARKREMAIRVALGASRWRLARQVLTEALLLSLSGAAVGVLFAGFALSWMAEVMDQYLPSTAAISLDGRVLLFTLFASGVTAVLSGLLPGFQLARERSLDLRETGAAASGRAMQRLRGLLVSAEIALSLMLLTAAVLLTQTMLKLQQQKVGMATDQVLTFKTAVSAAAYQGRNVATALFQPFLERLRTLPGVKSAGMINLLPLESWGFNGTFTLPRHATPKNPNDWSTEFRVVSPGYYPSLGITMWRGRDFSEKDVLGTQQVTIINDQFAKRYFGRENPIGQQIQIDNPCPVYTVMGVYSSNRQAGVAAPIDPEMDLSYLQIDPNSTWYTFSLVMPIAFVVRTGVSPETLTSAVQNALHELDPTQPIYEVQTMEEVRTHSLSGQRFALWLILTFAGLALVLAFVGVNGVMSYFVAQRTQEIGVRMALGASRLDILHLVLRRAVALTIIGTICGLMGALAAGSLIRSMLFGVSATDPIALGVAALLLAGMALWAAYLPALRAAKVDPLVALRYE
jgi:putative ABC transport system permease protein